MYVCELPALHLHSTRFSLAWVTHRTASDVTGLIIQWVLPSVRLYPRCTTVQKNFLAHSNSHSLHFLLLLCLFWTSIKFQWMLSTNWCYTPKQTHTHTPQAYLFLNNVVSTWHEKFTALCFRFPFPLPVHTKYKAHEKESLSVFFQTFRLKFLRLSK